MNVQNLKPEACYKMITHDEVSATKMLKDVVKYIGLGFHPDNCGMDYVSNEGKPMFEKLEAENLDTNILAAYDYISVYQTAMEAWHEFGMISTEQFDQLGGFIVQVTSQDDLLKLVNPIMADLAELDDKNCSVVDRDVTIGDTVGVRWMEYDGFPTMNDAIQEVANRLYAKTGRHFCISHNSPTDGHMIIFWEDHMDEEFNPKGHAEDFIRQFEAWYQLPKEEQLKHWNYILFFTLDCFLDRECDGTQNWKEHLDPNQEIWKQVMAWNLFGF